jgi:hypothetical protein
MRKRKRFRALMAFFLSMFVFESVSACATETISEKAIPLEEPQVGKGPGETEISLYYDFKDVPIPTELQIKREKYAIFQTTEFTAGLLTFSGRLNPDSLITFFSDKMSEDGWRLVGSSRSSTRIMFFLKEDRFCIITIFGKARATEVEILVTPDFPGKAGTS